MKYLTLLSFVFMLVSSCHRGDKRLDPFRWPVVSAEVDSLTLQLEYAFNDYRPTDSLLAMVAAFEKLSDGADSADVRNLRLSYWRGRMFQRQDMVDSAVRVVGRALSVTDSVRFPYEFFRLRALYRQLGHTRGAQSYRDVDEEARFYAQLGDAPMVAASYINMGTSLYLIGELDKGLEYIKKADDIHTGLGFNKMVARNAINVANIRYRQGLHREADSLLLNLLHSPEIAGDSVVFNLVMRNLYAHTNDVKWLKSAYQDVRGKENRRGLQGLYQALLSNHYDKAGQSDSAVDYSRLAMSNLDYISDYGYKGMVMQAYASTMEKEGKIDSALVYEKRYVEYSDSDMARMQQTEVLRMANIREVSLAMTRENERVQRMRFSFIGILFLVLLVAGAIYFMLYRRQQLHKIASRDSRLEMEKNRRHLLAVMLAMEEKNNLFNSLKSEIEVMRKEETIGAPEAARLENAIKLHLAGGEEWDTFQEMFVKANPDFVSRLHEVYPDLSDTYVKLATYIYMGLDNNKIARLLVIRPESVKQARWRLRKMMGLDKDVSLDDAIRALRN